jgi:penicillin-binding protein 1A
MPAPVSPSTSAARTRRVRLAAGLGAAFALVVAAFLAQLPDVRVLDEYRPPLPSIVVDRHGRAIGEFASERRQLVPLEALPAHVVKAFLAAEDENFYEHGGIDLGALLRAASANLRGGRVVQGGSTITQQLVKTLFLGPERTLWRKAREAGLALQLEARLSKDEILEIYLNQIYLGSGAYGVAAAARTYFDRDVADLTLGEGALLAGLPKAPSALSPLVNPEGADERRRRVLGRMRDHGFISEDEHAAAVAKRPRLRPAAPSEAFLASAYFVEEVRQALVERLGAEAVLRGGLRIETPIDLELQRRAARAVRAGLEASHRRTERRYAPPSRARRGEPGPPEVQGALVALDVASGEVLAWVGGYAFETNRFDRACQARRQPGSAFKTFAYGAALERGFPADTPVYDVQFEARNRGLAGGWWRPRNANQTLRGVVPLSEAFARSLNNASIRLANDVGVPRIVDFARRAGIRSPLARDLGIVLGTSEVTLLELTTAYSTFARAGRFAPPRFVRRVLDRSGEPLLGELDLCGGNPPPAAAGVSPVDAYLVTHLLRETVRAWYGTGHAAARLGPALAGKTGSTNENRDAWFVGFSPTVAAGVWVGRDDRRPMGGSETGARAALPIWVDFMETALAAYPSDRFAAPDGVLFAGYDAETGARLVTRQRVPGWVPVASGRRTRAATVVEVPPEELPVVGTILGGAALPAVGAPPPAGAD